jgi:hypothetical protein
MLLVEVAEEVDRKAEVAVDPSLVVAVEVYHWHIAEGEQ